MFSSTSSTSDRVSTNGYLPPPVAILPLAAISITSHHIFTEYITNTKTRSFLSIFSFFHLKHRVFSPLFSLNNIIFFKFFIFSSFPLDSLFHTSCLQPFFPKFFSIFLFFNHLFQNHFFFSKLIFSIFSLFQPSNSKQIFFKIFFNFFHFFNCILHLFRFHIFTSAVSNNSFPT